MSDIDIRTYIDARVQHIETMLGTMCRYIDTRFQADHDATAVAREAMDKRLDGMNEIRDALRDTTGMMLSKSEHIAYMGTIAEYMRRNDNDIRQLREASAEGKGKADQSTVARVATFAVIGVVMSVASLFCGGIGLLLALFSAFEVAFR